MRHDSSRDPRPYKRPLKVTEFNDSKNRKPSIERLYKRFGDEYVKRVPKFQWRVNVFKGDRTNDPMCMTVLVVQGGQPYVRGRTVRFTPSGKNLSC